MFKSNTTFHIKDVFHLDQAVLLQLRIVFSKIYQTQHKNIKQELLFKRFTSQPMIIISWITRTTNIGSNSLKYGCI
jgi:hypothetical protein